MGGPSGHILHPLLGDTMALLSAIFYALYVILLKVRIRTESRVDMQLFFGFVGLFNIVMCWPIGVVLHFTGVETFEPPTTTKVVAAILVNVSSIFASNFGSEGNLDPLDVHHLEQRLPLCSGDAKDNAPSCHAWPQSYNTFGRYWRLPTGKTEKRTSPSWSRFGINQFCCCGFRQHKCQCWVKDREFSIYLKILLPQPRYLMEESDLDPIR